ncbi:MAG: multidrug effflux MFS transporter [Rhizobiaceae bacterium]
MSELNMFSSATSPPTLFTLIVITALSVLSMNMYLPSLGNMATEFGVSYGLMNLSISGYLVVTGVLQLIIGPLSDRYGRRCLLLVAMALFAVASVGCALAMDMYVFLFFRMLQGAVIAGSALSRAVIRDMAGPQETARRLGHVNMAMALAPMLGPVLGGVLDELFGWRASFHVFALIGLFVFWLCWVDLGETSRPVDKGIGERFTEWQELFRSPRFWGYTVCIAFAIGAFFIFITGTPLVAQAALGLSPSAVGVCIGLITAGFVVGNIVSTRLVQRKSLTTMMIAGRIVALVGLLGSLVACFAGWVNVFTLFGGVVLVGFGNGVSLPSANAGALSVHPKLAGSASGVSGAFGVAVGAVVTWLAGFLLTPQNGPVMLLSLMLICVAISLLAALQVLMVDRRESRTIGVAFD